MRSNIKYNEMTINITISCRLDVVSFIWKKLEYYNNDEFREFNEEQLNTLFVDKEYTIKEEANKDECSSQEAASMTFGPSTLKEHMQNILEFEKVHRPTRIWFGSVDESHVYYEGLRENGDGSFSIVWGS